MKLNSIVSKLHHEWPLTVFTVLAQCAVGAFSVFGFINLWENATNSVSFRAVQIVIWGFLAVAFAASTFHLGSPKRAINALRRVGHSWLSNEIALGSLFFGLGGLYWLLSIFNVNHTIIGTGLLILALLISYGFVYAMVRVYQLPTSATWNNRYTGLSFFITVIFGGASLSVVLLSWTQYQHTPQITFIAIIAGLIALLIQLGQLISFAQAKGGVYSGRARLTQCANLALIRTACLGASILLFTVYLFVPHGIFPILAALFMLASELMGRDIFYRFQMSTGLS